MLQTSLTSYRKYLYFHQREGELMHIYITIDCLYHVLVFQQLGSVGLRRHTIEIRNGENLKEYWIEDHNWPSVRRSGGAVVYWIEPSTLDQRVVGSIPVNAWQFCPSARHSILLLSTQVYYKWVSGRMWTLVVAWRGIVCALKWRMTRMLPRELRWCTMSAGLILNPVTDGINTL